MAEEDKHGVSLSLSLSRHMMPSVSKVRESPDGRESLLDGVSRVTAVPLFGLFPVPFSHFVSACASSGDARVGLARRYGRVLLETNRGTYAFQTPSRFLHVQVFGAGAGAPQHVPLRLRLGVSVFLPFFFLLFFFFFPFFFFFFFSPSPPPSLRGASGMDSLPERVTRAVASRSWPSRSTSVSPARGPRVPVEIPVGLEIPRIIGTSESRVARSSGAREKRSVANLVHGGRSETPRRSCGFRVHRGLSWREFAERARARKEFERVVESRKGAATSGTRLRLELGRYCTKAHPLRREKEREEGFFGSPRLPRDSRAREGRVSKRKRASQRTTRKTPRTTSSSRSTTVRCPASDTDRLTNARSRARERERDDARESAIRPHLSDARSRDLLSRSQAPATRLPLSVPAENKRIGARKAPPSRARRTVAHFSSRAGAHIYI